MRGQTLDDIVDRDIGWAADQNTKLSLDELEDEFYEGIGFACLPPMSSRFFDLVMKTHSRGTMYKCHLSRSQRKPDSVPLAIVESLVEEVDLGLFLRYGRRCT